MSDKSSIEWTDATWTPIQAIRKDTGKRGVACVKVSPACKNCYAERLNMRHLPSHGTGLEFTVLNMEKVDIVLNEEILLWPSKWKRPRKIFVCSQTDLFGEFVSDRQIDRVFWAMAWNQRHTHQVLTKHADRMHKYCSDMAALSPAQRALRLVRSGGLFNIPDDTPTSGLPWPLPNVWLGVTAENQEWADKRIPPLLRTPAAVRFLSCEPLLGPIDLDLPRCDAHGRDELAEDDDGLEFCVECAADERSGELSYGHWLDPLNGGINWVITGGESGPGARPMRIEWAESLLEQCRESGAAFFLKQLGAYPIWAGAKSSPIEPARGKCDDMAHWPESLRVQEFPNV